jgi:hypothetical protein
MTVLSAFGSIDWIAVLLALAAYILLGGVWFAALFAKPYAAALGGHRAQPEHAATAVPQPDLRCAPHRRHPRDRIDSGGVVMRFEVSPYRDRTAA